METVLVVDGDQDTREILGAYLESNGYAVVEADNAFEALEVMLTVRPAVVVSELVVPWPGGHSMLDVLTWAAPVRGGITVILTADAFSQARERVVSLGASFLVKPLAPQDLLAEIQRRLSPDAAAPHGRAAAGGGSPPIPSS